MTFDVKLLITLCLAIGILVGVPTYLALLEHERNIKPVVELCEDYANEYTAAFTCQKDFNCVLTLEDYNRLVIVDKFAKRYCSDERKTSKEPPTITGDKEAYTL